MQTILVAIDFSPVSRRVIETAMMLARTVAGRVVLLHVVQPPMIVTDLAPLAGEALKFTAAVERGARQRLHRLQTRVSDGKVPVDTLCEQGSAVPLIVSCAKRLDAHYIVIGSHGHTALYELVVGGTASGVLKHAPCPVVVVPAQPKRVIRRTDRVTERARRGRPRKSLSQA